MDINVTKKMCITFIGMPGTGKSYTSKLLSKKYNIPIVELDSIIEEKYNMTLPEIIKKYGEEEFKNIETNAILSIDLNTPKLISPGGSIIYCEKGMDYLINNNNIIIHLKTDFDILKKRTENFTNRGIVFNGQTPYELYKNREILYNKYAHTTIDLSGKKENEIYELFKFLE